MWDEKAQKPKRNHPNKIFIESIIDEKKKDYREKILELNAMGKDYTPETLVSAVEKVVQKTLTVGSYFKEHIEAMEKAGQLLYFFKTAFLLPYNFLQTIFVG